MSFTTVGLLILLWICMAVKGQSFNYSHCEGRYCFLSDGNKFQTIQDARSYCSSRGAWLLELYDQETDHSFSNALKGQLNQIHPNGFPIFLNMEILTDRWIWINQVQSSVTIAHQNQGQSVATLFTTQSGHFNYAAKQSNDIAGGFICSNTITSCSSNMKLDSRCYYVIRTQTTWYQASNECLRMNSRLATFESMSDEQMNVLFSREDINYFWVGLLRNALKWSHKNTVVEYSKWKRDLPKINQNIHCPNINTQQFWDFVCKPQSHSLSVCMKDFIFTPSSPAPITTTSILPIPSFKNSSTTPIHSTTTLTNNSTKVIKETGALSTEAKIGIGIAVVLLCIIITAVVILLVLKFKPNLKSYFPKKFGSKSSSSPTLPLSSSHPHSTTSATPAVVEAMNYSGPIYAEPLKNFQPSPNSLQNTVDYAELSALPENTNAFTDKNYDNGDNDYGGDYNGDGGDGGDYGGYGD